MMTHSILIVEDDKELRNIYRRILENEGFGILEATNGAEAIDILSHEQPDVLILDMLMPTMGGDMVLRRLPSLSLPDMKVIVISAYSSFREKAEASHADVFLVKPVEPKEVLRTIQQVLED